MTDPDITAYPSELVLEVTNHCNLRCVMCHFHGSGVSGNRSKGRMDQHLWTSIIDEVGRSGEPCSVVTHGAGEPLLFPDLEVLVRRAKTYPNLTVGFLTNGMFLTEDVSRMVIDTGLDWIAFSVDGVNPETHSRYRVNSDLPTIEKNIRNLAELRGEAPKPSIRFNMVRLPELEDQVEPYVRRWQNIADNIMISKYRPVGKRTFLEIPFPRTPCPLLRQQMVVAWDGTVGLCCEDIFADVPIGNAGKQSVREIWHGKELGRVRMAHREGKYNDLALCRDCDTWAAGMELTSRIRDDGWQLVETPAQTVYRPTASLPG